MGILSSFNLFEIKERVLLYVGEVYDYLSGQTHLDSKTFTSMIFTLFNDEPMLIFVLVKRSVKG